MSFYKTIEQEGVAEFKDRGSRFLAYAYPFKEKDELKGRLLALKKEHPKAVHYCFAYRLGANGDNFRSSDDGEPSGTAGKPILGQIDSKELTDVLIIVVRYFGGSLLGVPGLINAYKSAAAMALQVVPAVSKPLMFKCALQFDYTESNNIQRLLKQYGCEIISREDLLFSVIKIGVPVSVKEELFYRLGNLRNVEISTLL